MFRMTYIGGIHAPTITCGLCARRIEKATDGIVLYGYTNGESLPCLDHERDRQIIVHKRSCQRQVMDDYAFSHELETVLVWLEQNLKFDGKARANAEFKAEMLSKF